MYAVNNGWGVVLFFLLFLVFANGSKLSKQMRDDMDKQRVRWNSGEPPKIRVNLTEKDNKYFKDLRTRRLIKPRSGFSNPGIRRELRCMSKKERLNYFEAVNKMKSTMIGTVSEYDEFAARHTADKARPAHNCISFLGWHREFITSFELALQTRCPGCMQPYWDNRLDARLEFLPADSVYFSDQLMGNSYGDVVTGVAANWTVHLPNCHLNGREELFRNFSNKVDGFYDDREFHVLDEATDVKQFSRPWNAVFEDLHGDVHGVFGKGSLMQDIVCSPSDPIFYQHHTLLDLMFEAGRQSLIKKNALIYPDLADSALEPDQKIYCAAKAPMMPFMNRTNDYGLLSDTYTKDIYKYEKPPGDVNCVEDSDCCANGNVEFLWCNAKGRCVSKVAEGGRVRAIFPDKACFCETGTPTKVNLRCACV